MDVTQFIRRIVSRTEAAEDCLLRDELTDEEIDTIHTGIKKQNFVKFGFRGALIPVFMALYKNKFFDQKSKYFLREIGLICAGVFYFTAVDQFGSYLMWNDCGEIVQRYSNYSDNFALSSDSMKKMEQMYKMKQANIPKTRTLNQDQQDKMYVDDDDEDDE